MTDVTNDPLLTPEILEKTYFALKTHEVEATCRLHMSEALERLVALAATARDARLRRKAAAVLAGRLREAGLDVERPAKLT